MSAKRTHGRQFVVPCVLIHNNWCTSCHSLFYSILIYRLFLVAAVQVNLPIATSSFSNCLVLGPLNPIFSAISSVLYNTSNSIHASICFCLSDNNASFVSADSADFF